MKLRRDIFKAFVLCAVPLSALAAGETAREREDVRERDKLDAQALSKAPRLKQAAKPVYPPAALERRLSADVTLLLDIDERGEVLAAAAANPSDDDLGFERAALEAAYALSFEPAEIDGTPVPVQVSYTFRFRPPPLVVSPDGGPDGGPVNVADGAVDGTFDGAVAPARDALPAADTAPARPVALLRGRVLERGTREPLDHVTLLLYQEDVDPSAQRDARVLTSGPDGSFDAGGVPAGRWTVAIDNAGHVPFKTVEELRAGELATATYYLERSAANPYDVVVTSTRARKEVSRTVVDDQVIGKAPGAASDPLAVVQDLAGVARVPFGQGDIIVRGSAPRDTQVFVGGTAIPTAYHFGGLRSVLPLAVVDSLDFYPGNFSVYYGRGTGGIIDVSLKKLSPKRAGGYADINLYDAGMYLEIPIGRRAALAIAARRSYVDTLLKAFFPSDADVSFATAPRYYDAQLLGQYRPRPGHDLRFMLFGSDDRFALLFRQPADFDPQAGGNQFGLSTSFYRSLYAYTYTPNTTFSNTLRFAQGRNWLSFGIGVLSFDVNTYTTQVRDTASFRFSDRVTMTLGADVSFLRGGGTIALPPRQKEGQPPANTDYSDIRRAEFSGLTWISPATFAEFELVPWPGGLLVPGLRFDYFSRTDAFTVEPRLSARQRLGSTLVVKGGVGLFHQEPDFGEDYPGFGNPKLRPERAWHYAVGAEWQIAPGLGLDTTLFYKSLQSLVSPTSRTTVDGGVVTPLIYDNGGRGRVYGVEALLRRDLTSGLTGWIAYTLSRSERLDSGSTEWRLFDYDQTHILTALASYKIGRRWTIGGRFRVVSGNPRTPVVASVVNVTADRYEPIYGRVNSTRNPLFHQLDLRVDRRWIFDRWILDVYLDVQNVYNHRYAEGVQYSYDYGQSRPATGLPLLTIFGVRGEI